MDLFKVVKEWIATNPDAVIPQPGDALNHVNAARMSSGAESSDPSASSDTVIVTVAHQVPRNFLPHASGQE